MSKFTNVRSLAIRNDREKILDFKLFLPSMTSLTTLTLGELGFEYFHTVYSNCRPSLHTLKIPFHKYFEKELLKFLETMIESIKSIERASPLTLVFEIVNEFTTALIFMERFEQEFSKQVQVQIKNVEPSDSYDVNYWLNMPEIQE